MTNDVAEEVRRKRERLGLTQKEFALLLDLKENGERTVSGWERGEHSPSKSRLQMIANLPERAPFKARKKTWLNFIDLFAGIGGIRLPFQELGGRCVFTSEWDKFAQKTYAANFGEVPAGDITKIRATDIPDHDLLLAGFPCQAFSQAGLKKGFSDTRGTMFFEIQRVLVAKRPKAFLLENVKQLKGHNKGKTLNTILEILTGNNETVIPKKVPMSADAREALTEKLNYWVDYKILRAGDFGVPQNRERIFIIGFNKDYFSKCDFDYIYEWPTPPMLPTKLGDILEDSSRVPPAFTISDRIWESHQRRKLEHQAKGNGFGYSLFTKDSPYANTISARYYKDGSEILIDQSELRRNPRLLTPRECARLQGFPENFIVDAVSKGQTYKQFGNSVCVTVIHALAGQLLSALRLAEGIQAGSSTHPKISRTRSGTQLSLLT